MKVLIATGGSGGHIFPALQTGIELTKRGHQVIFAGAFKMAAQKVRAAGFEVLDIPAGGLNGHHPLAVVRFGFSMACAVFHARKILKETCPDKVIGFGGFGSFAVIVAAWMKGVPLMIHEQNMVPGKANRVMARMALKVAVSFQDSARFFGSSKTVWTGCPCNHRRGQWSRAQLAGTFQLDPAGKVVLVLGGSQGSTRLNEVFFEWMRVQGKTFSLQAVHMTGHKEYALYQQRYALEQLPVRVCAFIEDIEQAYALADVVIARAGASTVCELGLLGKAAVLVPYPFAGGHQVSNARVLTDRGAAVLLEQKDLDPASLGQALSALLADRADQGIGQRVKGLFKEDAAEQLALAVEAL